MVAGLGIVVGVAYTLRAVHHAFFGEASGETNVHAEPLEPVSVPERFGALLLIGASVLIGLFPRLLLDWIEPGLRSPLFQNLWKGGAQ